MKYEDFNTTLINECELKSTKLDIIYNESDSRCWTALIGKDDQNLLVTFHVNRGDLGKKNFDVLGNRKQLIEVPVQDIYDIIVDIIK